MENTPLARAEIRAQVERRLRRSLTDEEWDLFVEMGSVGLVEDGEETVHWLVRRIREMLARIDALASKRASRSQGRSQARQRDEISPTRSGGSYDFTRQDAICLAVAALATNDPEVITFRQEVLGGQLLTYTLDSSREGVEEWIPDQIERERPQLEAFSGEPPVLTYIKFLGHGPETIPIAPRGDLDRLRQLGERLSKRYRWASHAAVAFALSGDVIPTIEVLTATIQPNHEVPGLTRITITVDPATTPADVARAYRQARNRITQKRAHEMQPKTLFLAAFATERPRRESLKSQMKKWNEVAPDPAWGYEPEQAANFARDRNWALERLLQPDYRLPDHEETITYDNFTASHDARQHRVEPDESA